MCLSQPRASGFVALVVWGYILLLSQKTRTVFRRLRFYASPESKSPWSLLPTPTCGYPLKGLKQKPRASNFSHCVGNDTMTLAQSGWNFYKLHRLLCINFKFREFRHGLHGIVEAVLGSFEHAPDLIGVVFLNFRHRDEGSRLPLEWFEDVHRLLFDGGRAPFLLFSLTEAVNGVFVT